MRALSIAVVSTFLLLSGTALAQAPQSQASTGNGGQASTQFPVCDRTHADSCLELGQNAQMDRQLRQDYPQCAKMAGTEQRAACFNRAQGHG